MKNTKTITTYNISVFFFHSSIILGEVISSIKMQKEKVTCRFHMIHRENKCRMNTSCSPQQKSAIHFAPKSLARNHPRKAIGLVMIGGYFAGKKTRWKEKHDGKSCRCSSLKPSHGGKITGRSSIQSIQSIPFVDLPRDKRKSSPLR